MEKNICFHAGFHVFFRYVRMILHFFTILRTTITLGRNRRYVDPTSTELNMDFWCFFQTLISDSLRVDVLHCNFPSLGDSLH